MTARSSAAGWQPRVASVLLYLHSSILGAIAISAFWSLLNERFDPHSAKPLLAKVAAAASFGGLVGGVVAERVAALLPQGARLLILGMVGAACTVGAIVVGRGMPARRGAKGPEDASSGWDAIRRTPLLRDLALVIALAAALVDIQAAQYSLSDFTMAESLAGLDPTAILRALEEGTGPKPTQASLDDPVWSRSRTCARATWAASAPRSADR